MKYKIVLLQSLLLLAACEQKEFVSESEEYVTRGSTLSVKFAESLSIDLMKNMKLLYFGITDISGVKQYMYEGFYDLSDITYNSSTDSWTKDLPAIPFGKMGVMVVAQENIPSNHSYLLPATGQGKEATLVNLIAENSSIITGMAYTDAPVVFASDMMDVEWLATEPNKKLKFNIMRVVGKLVITINDHDNTQTKDIYFKISNTSTSCNYGINYSGFTTKTIPHIVRVDKISKQGIAYLLPTLGSNALVIEPVDPALKLNITTPLVVKRNKITEATIDYHGTLNMTVSGTLKDWTDMVAGEADWLDITDSENIGYNVINVGGILWLDRDLGAKYPIPRKPTSIDPTDLLSDDDWGYLFQFGRLRDGHQRRNSVAATGALTSIADATKLWFVYSYPSWLFILTSGMVNLWENPSQANNPCPAGFRVPTLDELKTLYAKLSYDTTLQGYYVDGIRKGKTARMYLFGKISRASKDGKIVPPLNQALYYWTSSQRWTAGSGTSNFYGKLPMIQVVNNKIVLGNDAEYAAAMGFNVRCIYDKSSDISH